MCGARAALGGGINAVIREGPGPAPTRGVADFQKFGYFGR